MSFFKKALASIGFGSAKVDSVLHQEVLYPGDKANITINVEGGSIEQEIDTIYLKVCCHYYYEETVIDEDDPDNEETQRITESYVLAEWNLPEAFTLQAGEKRDFEVELEIPWNTPLTFGDAEVWLETGLDIALALDPCDCDTLTVKPDPLMDGIFSVLEQQGLQIRQVECEAASGFAMPFVQEFEFVPASGFFYGRLQELEIVAYRDESELKLWFELDRKLSGVKGFLASMLGAGELKRQLSIPADTPPNQAGEEVLAYLVQTLEETA